MGNYLLLKKRVLIKPNYIEFLRFIHPHFEIVDDLDTYDNPNTQGIIYTGKCTSDTENRLNKITDKWIIVSGSAFNVDLSTNDGLVKNILPISYVQLKSNNDLEKLYKISYDELLEKVKVSLITGTNISLNDTVESSVYQLFSAIICSEDVLNKVFFSIVNKDNVSYILSSVLRFLGKVQSLNVKNESGWYSRLITQSNYRYGKKIKPAINAFIKSKANKEVALHQLLLKLNRGWQMARQTGLKDIYTYIKNLIESMEIIPTAGKLSSFKELKSSPEKFFELFSEATYKYNIICDALQKLQYSNAMIVKALNELMSADCREQFNVKSQYIKLFTSVKSECNALIAGYETAKASAESIVKFYNNAQYIITSGRFDQTSANY